MARVVLTDDDGSGNTGTILNNAWLQAVYDSIDPAIVGQIQFPATQVPSANLNTLDDYEEGTWTPELGGSTGTSGQTYGGRAGAYIKIGRFVHCHGYLGLSAKGTISGNVVLYGLPFTAENASVQYASLTISHFQNLATNWIWLGGYLTPNEAVCVLRGMQAAGTGASTLTTTDISNTTELFFSISYRAAS